LPFADRAVLDARKVSGYLLSDSHPVGRHKSRVFRALGYHAVNADRLVRDLLDVARSGAIGGISATKYGHRYIVDGAVRTPSGVVAVLRTAWITRHGSTTPHFITAFPLPRETA
jgi:hypothetical protein